MNLAMILRVHKYRRSQNIRRGALQISSTPPTAQTAGAIGLIFGLGAVHRHRSGVTVAIFEFPSGTPKIWPHRGAGTSPPESEKMENIFFSIFLFFLIGMYDGMFKSTENSFPDYEFIHFAPILYDFPELQYAN